MNINRKPLTRVIDTKKTPDWVPPIVGKLAIAMHPFGQEIVDRVLTDPRMAGVWPVLLRQNIDASAIEALPSNLRVANWPSLETPDATPGDEACVAFFAAVVIELKLANKPIYPPGVSALISPWRNAACQCRDALENPLFRPRINVELERSLIAVAEFFEEKVAFVESGSSPYLLGRKRKDDARRVLARGIATQCQLIFGQFLCGTIATTVNVGLQLEIGIDADSVRNWCEGLRPANK